MPRRKPQRHRGTEISRFAVRSVVPSAGGQTDPQVLWQLTTGNGQLILGAEAWEGLENREKPEAKQRRQRSSHTVLLSRMFWESLAGTTPPHPSTTSLRRGGRQTQGPTSRSWTS